MLTIDLVEGNVEHLGLNGLRDNDHSVGIAKHKVTGFDAYATTHYRHVNRLNLTTTLGVEWSDPAVEDGQS